MNRKRIIKWFLRIILTTVALIVLWISVLAFPHPFFADSISRDNITLYSDQNFGPEIDSVLNDIIYRLNAVSMSNPENDYDIFICNSQSKFKFYVTLAMQKTQIQGLNLSILGNSFISVERVNALAEAHNHCPPYNIRAGNLAHVICHELAHNYHSDKIGLFSYGKLPMWKTEGIAEYGAHYGALVKDSTASLENRLTMYLDESNWRPGDSYVKQIYISELLVEYLITVEQYSLEQIGKDSVNYHDVFNRLMQWYDKVEVNPS